MRATRNARQTTMGAFDIINKGSVPKKKLNSYYRNSSVPFFRVLMGSAPGHPNITLHQKNHSFQKFIIYSEAFISIGNTAFLCNDVACLPRVSSILIENVPQELPDLVTQTTFFVILFCSQPIFICFDTICKFAANKKAIFAISHAKSRSICRRGQGTIPRVGVNDNEYVSKSA